MNVTSYASHRKFHSSHVPSAIIRKNLVFYRYPQIDTCNDNHHDDNNNNRHMIFFRTRFRRIDSFRQSSCVYNPIIGTARRKWVSSPEPLIGKHCKFTILDLLALRSAQSHGDGHCRIKWIDLHMEHILIELPSMSILSHVKHKISIAIQNRSHLTLLAERKTNLLNFAILFSGTQYCCRRHGNHWISSSMILV